jgi:hypothetical protein
MAKRLGPIEIDCDAPPYPIVQACRRLGLRDPEDVRWCRMSRGPSGGWWKVLQAKTWSKAPAPGKQDARCACGGELPELPRYTFTLLSGTRLSFFLGQCGYCRTILWSEG